MDSNRHPKPGDKVRLKSGGPYMTLGENDKGDPRLARCYWFAGYRGASEEGEYRSELFPPIGLMLEETLPPIEERS
jgi:uncharacterized protein YodC (DUF2158 family)